jgi:hypothetical protein
MLFKPELVTLILAGAKTQTRRMVRPDDCTPSAWKAALGDWFPVEVAWKDGDSVQAVIGDGPRLRYGVNQTYAVQPGRGKHAVARILVTTIRYCERTGDISEDDARAEGFADADGFEETYARLNGAGALEQPCWALTFALMGDAEQPGGSPLGSMAGGDGR